MSRGARSLSLSSEEDVPISIATATLGGSLTLPGDAAGLVIFAHGSGSSRFSTRNRRVAHALQYAGFGTLLFDLLTESEERQDAFTGHLRFDIDFLATRLQQVTRWVQSHPETQHLPIGFFGASTGAAAALVAAAKEPENVRAVVSRGGRPDLASDHLPNVQAATLLIVGGEDEPVIPLNEYAFARIKAIKRLEIVPGATHLFEEPGALEAVADLAAAWFEFHLRPTVILKREDAGS